MSRQILTAGQAAFEAYRRARGGKNHDGSPTPTWDEVGDGVRLGWESAASASMDWMRGNAEELARILPDAEREGVLEVLEAHGYDTSSPAATLRTILEELAAARSTAGS